jgi:hypothetical protein
MSSVSVKKDFGSLERIAAEKVGPFLALAVSTAGNGGVLLNNLYFLPLVPGRVCLGVTLKHYIQ